MLNRKLVIGSLVLSLVAVAAIADETRLYIIAPADGARVTSPVQVVFGLSGMGVAPAGIEKENTGHHHLLIDVSALPQPGMPIPADAYHRHFGGGQTETLLELEPGQHSLQLLLGDHGHIPHSPPLASETIHITVMDASANP